MQLGVNVPNFGPGTDPDVLREWARIVEGLGFGLLMVSDHVVITPDVAERYPGPFYEPFTTLSWLGWYGQRSAVGCEGARPSLSAFAVGGAHGHQP